MKSTRYALTVFLAVVVALPSFADETPNKFIDTGGNLRLAPTTPAPVVKSSSTIKPKPATAADSTVVAPVNQVAGHEQEAVSPAQPMMPAETGLPAKTQEINGQPSSTLPASSTPDAVKLNQPQPESMQAVPVAPVSHTPPASDVNPAIVNQKPASTY